MARFETLHKQRFVQQIHIHAYDQRAYWIGGTSNMAPGDCCLSGYSLPDNGKSLTLNNYCINTIKIAVDIIKAYWLLSMSMFNNYYVKKSCVFIFTKF